MLIEWEAGMSKKTILKMMLVVLFLFCFWEMVRAARLEVTTTNDNVPGSLRAAITAANSNNEDDTIFLQADTYTLTTPGSKEDQNASGDIDIHSNITIVGAGASDTLIQAGTVFSWDPLLEHDSVDRIFHIHPGATVVMRGITLRYGIAPDGENVDKGYAGNGLKIGTYSGTIKIISEYADNSPQNIPVILNVYGEGQTLSPFGEMDTPGDGAVVYGSIPVTGWGLDDIGIQNIQVFRVAGTNPVYIGDAVFVEGARPDVEQSYPGYPHNTKAGWGYIMLTNFLPDAGNGTFKIQAIAIDSEGNQVTLGTKVIICENSKATKPFGAIDTPGQGGTASGSNYINWGWALTPQPGTIPADGSGIMVWVDSMPVGNPVYNLYRKDIATLFPGYNNSQGAVGYFSLDTTQYKNGVHTMAWSVTDDAGNTDGIGSRYFSILNINSSIKNTGQTQ